MISIAAPFSAPRADRFRAKGDDRCREGKLVALVKKAVSRKLTTKISPPLSISTTSVRLYYGRRHFY
jgi:hypothetical protein